MADKLGRTIKLPPIPPEIDNKEIRKYLQELERAIKDFVERVYDDLHY